MLHFFRKNQKIFFLLITVVIVLTFVFFGTYQAIAPGFGGKGEEETSYVDQMTRFLNTEQWMISRKFFAANFLNDGVISKEFLETGMADLVALAYPDRFGEDFNDRLARERNYTPYSHPFLPSLSAMSIWSIFAPDLPAKLKAHQEGSGAFKLKNELFLAQKSFPPAFVSQIIRYQEQSQPNFPSDPRLGKEDVALFGYQGLTDWFGEHFVGSIAEGIIQTAAVARKLGYKVTHEELLAELVSRSQETYEILKQKVDLPVEDGYGLFQLYLRQIGMREKTALKIWEDVTLFRRLMHSVGDAALTDALPLSEFYTFASENATVELYQMPVELRLKNQDDLKWFEVYLAAVGEKKSSALDIPLEYAPLETIESCTPELVGKHYELYFAQTSKKALQAKVSVKETVQWECDLENWKKLLHQFPELAHKTGLPFDILESMDDKARKLIDSFARKHIVEAHPEWIAEALVQANLEEKTLFLNAKTEKPFEGIHDVALLIEALEGKNELIGFSQDGDHFYRFHVRGWPEHKEILSYKEALKAGILDKISEKMEGDILAQVIVDASPSEYKKEAYAFRFAPFISKYRYNPPKGQLAEQFVIEKREKTITRSESSFISIDDVLALEPGSFSPLGADPKEGAYLYRFVEKGVDKAMPVEKMKRAQELLSKEARCRYFEQLLTHFRA